MKVATFLPSCTVASPIECNSATIISNATNGATQHETKSLKALANKVLQRNQKSNDIATLWTDDASFNIENKLLKAPGDDNQTIYGFTLEDLKEFAGIDWEWIKDDTLILRVFADACLVMEERNQGIVPKSHTAKTYCAHCGTVFVPPSITNGGYVLGCPWCLTNHYINRRSYV